MTLSILMLVAAFALFAGLALYMIMRADRQRRAHRARLMRVRTETATTPQARRRAATSAGASGLIARLERELAQTNLRVSLTELLVQISMGTLGLYAFCVLVAGMHPLLAAPFALAGPVMTFLWILRIAKNRYRTAFIAELPEALDVFARGLRAGRPVSDSLGIVVETAKGPIQTEFSRCHNEISMGTTLSDSLARLETRIPTPEVSFFAVATALQHETGGNLIETMEGLAAQLRERRKLRRKARALSSEARASALILAALPFAVTLVIGLMNGSYLEPLYADPRGRIMALTGLTSISLGVFVMAQMGKLDV